MHKSIWEATAKLPHFPTLDRDISTDVLIIGGGIAGLLCAHLLEQENADYILCEADTVCSGTTAKTTAVLSAQHDILYGDLIKKYGIPKAKLYLDANLNAVKKYKKLAKDIDCDLEIRPSYLFSSDTDKSLENEADAVKSLGFNAKTAELIDLPLNSEIAVCFGEQAQFHPLKFLSAIAQNKKIYEHTRIVRTDGTTAFTDTNRIVAKKIIVCTHFPIINTNGLYFAKLYQKRSFVLALENAGQYKGTYVDRKSGMYFRNYKQYLLVGGGDHRTGSSKNGFKTVRDFAKEHFKNATEKYAWATQDCMSLDGIPYIGKYSKNLPNVYVATGFNEWGMTSSMVAAEIITDMILGKENKYSEIFTPQRSMLEYQLLANLGSTAINFLTPTVKRCPHLGCALKWNKYEHTWDCPCHGSRFEKDGKVINGPATGDSDIIKKAQS